MKDKNLNIKCCERYKNRVEHLLALDDNHPERMEWTRHSHSCALCREVIAADEELNRLVRSLPEPRPALVAGAVIARIREGRNPAPIKRRNLIWALGGSLMVGFIIGIGLNAILPKYNLINTSFDTGNYLVEYDDGLDDLYTALLTESEGDTK